MAEVDKAGDGGGGSGLAPDCVRTFLERHGVPRPKQALKVAEILGFTSNSQGHRRLTKGAQWSLEELQAVARHFGKTLQDIVSLEPMRDMEEAEISVAGDRLLCRIALGPIAEPGRGGGLVAVRTDSKWLVTKAPANVQPSYEIERIIIDSARSKRRYAVVEDDPVGLETMVSFLRNKGEDCVGFSNLEAARAAGDFDGYVLDWIFEQNGKRTTARDFIGKVRARNPDCPIIVLTGQMLDSGSGIEEEIIAAMKNFNLQVFEKPTRPSLIATGLTRRVSS